MTQAELCAALNTLGLPVAYRKFVATPQKPAPAPPYLVYLFAYSGDLMADNANYLAVSNFQVELYTSVKSLADEKKVEDLFKSLNLPYRKIEAWIESEKMCQVVYEIQLIGG